MPIRREKIDRDAIKVPSRAPQEPYWNETNIFESDVPDKGSRADIIPVGPQVTLDNVYKIYDIPDLRITARDITDQDRREDNLDRIYEEELKVAAEQAAAQAAVEQAAQVRRCPAICR